jgi:hypothetical protein
VDVVIARMDLIKTKNDITLFVTKLKKGTLIIYPTKNI